MTSSSSTIRTKTSDNQSNETSEIVYDSNKVTSSSYFENVKEEIRRIPLQSSEILFFWSIFKNFRLRDTLGFVYTVTKFTNPLDSLLFA